MQQQHLEKSELPEMNKSAVIDKTAAHPLSPSQKTFSLTAKQGKSHVHLSEQPVSVFPRR